ncbi:MAG: permease [Bacillota bacterium]|nr:MAG: permease [Bacillota bacterium]
MHRLLVFALAGLVAQLVDGALGMAYGVMSSSLLLVYGLSPAAASASVHLAELVTTATSGISHWRLGNVDRVTVLGLIVPGAVGAFSGAVLLSSLPGDLVRPYVAGFLLLLGTYIVLRFALAAEPGIYPATPIRRRFLMPLGLMAGLLDATGGGGWGPIATPALMVRGYLPPHKVVGSVSASEFVVALSATLGFAVSLGWSPVNWLQVGALVAGGAMAAPLGAWLARRLPSPVLGVLVGTAVLLVNLRTLCSAADITGAARTATYGLTACTCLAFLVHAIRKSRRAGPGGEEALQA